MKIKSIISVTALTLLTLSSVASVNSFAQTDTKKQENSQMHQDNMPGSRMGQGPMNRQGQMSGQGQMMGQGNNMGNGMGPQGGMGRGGMMMGNTGMMPMMGRGGMMGMMGQGGMMGPGGMMGMMQNHHGMGYGKWFIEREYTSEDAQRIVDGLLARRGFAKLKVSKVEKAEEGYLKVEVSTTKGEAVLNLKFDINSGRTTIIQ